MAKFNSQLDGDDGLVVDINMTPLIDVMLVLLIVFMVTLPVVTHAVKLQLPSGASKPDDSKPAHIDVSVDANGTVSWAAQPLDAAALEARLAVAAVQQPQPEIQLYADRASRYEAVADLLAAAQRAGLTKIDFLIRPKF